MNKLFNTVVVAQAAYIFITGIWPLIDINSFMAVTGKKTDLWLVKTVGALLLPVASCLGMYRYLNADKRPAILLGGAIAVAFISIDFYYALTDVISDIYLVDGIIEVGFLLVWIIVAINVKRPAGSESHSISNPVC
ncbi:hypothetical protein KK062_06800 [Fulvivirgaceae bacterium PWU5]|uniref:Uncharacterized protein n=1 Tax=Dawidia cretensis TaxID=2782350 RepID=A0AAP2GNV4_9BACT|nr:hypothetical protein [Dawidia cretensis]MBT1707921.1 hypothetical protein [Dawidia cretensis]